MSLAYVQGMNRFDFYIALDGHPHARAGRHEATRLHAKTMQNFYETPYEFEGWLRNTAFSFPGEYDDFMTGLRTLVEQGFFKGWYTGISEIYSFQACVPTVA